ncbi:MAG: GTP-binding protein [Deltaproteobacteria bacterium]|nr:MAG: GTP-binding protein [Deltaproteobacteria bacterium]
MSDVTRVYLITGFLGSGKTTFLNRIINRFPRDKKLTLLVNEFGEIGVDGTLVEGEDIDMMEISKGSIFCVCVKTDFIKGLYELNTKVQPDVLLIESTGVANPSDLKKDLTLPIFKDRFQFAEQFCVIDAAHFLDAYGVFASIEKQIASSSTFIINKTDLAPPEQIEEIKKVVFQFHPSPKFFETTFADIPLEKFFDLEPCATIESSQPDLTIKKESGPILSAQELDKFLDDLLGSPDLEITPPDTLVSVAYQWEGKNLDQIRAMAENLPASVVRAKGFVAEKGKMHLFSYVMGDWTIEETDLPKERIQHKNIVVFIGPPESMEGIEEASKTGDWSSKGIFHAYSPASE